MSKAFKDLDHIVIDFTINEIENLLMMHRHAERYMQHEFALSAVRKIQKARGIYIARFGADALPEPEPEIDLQASFFEN